ncbi:SMAD/FHA domain-containing protein, partial [Pseudomassariella vexata]
SHRSRQPRHKDDFEYDRDRRSGGARREDSRRHGDKYGKRGVSRDRLSRQLRRSRSPRSPRPDDLRRSSPSRDRDRHRDKEHQRPTSRHGHDIDGENETSRLARDGRPEYSKDSSRSKQVVKCSGPLPSQADSFAVTNGEKPLKEKERPNFGTTGTLAAVSNSIQQPDGSTIVLKYHEPPEARKPSPKDRWKLFVFKGADIIDTIELNHRTCWLVGRELAVVDMAAEHPSISKQHAVIQFRYLEKRNEYGDKIGKVKPYLIDLDSANGTMINKKKMPETRYLELRDKDLIQFGQSTREYLLMRAPKD